MPDPQHVVALAEAVADGRPIDWSSVKASAADAVERDVIAKLHVVHAIHGLLTTRSSRQSLDGGRVVLSAGDQWGALEIREHLGRGRFGDVYRAWDPALDREVALKLLRHDDRGADAETRVVEEGRLMARVRHPNVVAIYGAQRLAGVSGLWMELVEGRTLAAELAEHGPFEAEEISRVGIELARALDAVHRAGLVHRDVKAQNVLREAGGRIVLGDFGTGRELDEPAEARGGLAGTPAYLAPEIFAGQPATPRSDLYSLGALLFLLATGQHAVPGRSLRELRDAHALGNRRSIDALRPDLPDALRRGIAQALDPDPSGRFESGEQMASALEGAVGPSGVLTPWTRLVAIAALLTVSIGAALYSGTPAARPEAKAVPAAAAAAHSRPGVLVAAFENHTGEPTLDAALAPTLARALAGSAAYDVVPAARVQDTLALMRRAADTRLDPDVARELARRDGEVAAVVTGRIDESGDRYVVSIEARSPDGPVLGRRTSAHLPYGAVVDTVQRLGLQLRSQLATSMPVPEPQRPHLPRVTTASLHALELYASALALRDGEGLYRDRQPEAERLVRAAIEEDPTFVAAHVQLAILVRLDGGRRAISRLDEALAHAERAVALSSTVSRFERIRAEEQRHFIRFLMNPPEPEASLQARALIASCEELLQLRPDDPDVLLGCVNFYELTGTPNPDVAARLADMRPDVARWQMTAASSVLAATPDRIDRVRHYVDRAARLAPEGETQAMHVALARLVPAREAWLAKRPEQALDMAHAMRAEMLTLGADERTMFARQLWWMYLDLGRLRDAEAVITGLTPWPTRRNAEVIVAVAREDRLALRALLARNFPKIEDAGGVASAFMEAGLPDEGRRLIEAHRKLEATRPGQFSQYLLMLEGHQALVEGRRDEAIDRFERFLAVHGSRTHTGRSRRVRRLLAEALIARGALDRAGATLEIAVTPPDLLNPASQELLLAKERLAAVYRRLGREPEAGALEAELRALMAVADDDHPIKRRLTAAAASITQ